MNGARSVRGIVIFGPPYFSAGDRVDGLDHCDCFFTVCDCRIIGVVDRVSAGKSPKVTSIGCWGCCSALRKEEKSGNESGHALRSVETHLGLATLLGFFEGGAG